MALCEIHVLTRHHSRDGLWATVVVDESGNTLGLVYSSEESINASLTTLTGTYQSRSRGLWVKGLTSGDTQVGYEQEFWFNKASINFIFFLFFWKFHVFTRLTLRCYCATC